jgi:hypothetical protein
MEPTTDRGKPLRIRLECTEPFSSYCTVYDADTGEKLNNVARVKFDISCGAMTTVLELFGGFEYEGPANARTVMRTSDGVQMYVQKIERVPDAEQVTKTERIAALREQLRWYEEHP